MPVNSEHKLYSEFKNDWKEIRDCVKGNRAIKKEKETYLPRLTGQDKKAYERYLKRVKFFGATGRTLDGLHGNVFRKAPTYTGKVSDSFLESLKDVDLKGTNIEQFVSDIITDELPTNWGGILVDYARGEEAVSLAEADAKGLKWYLKYYPAECVINWENKTINGKNKLSMVVLIEHSTTSKPDDRFVVEPYIIYRVLYLDPKTNKYKQDIYDDRFSLTEPKEKEIIIKMNGSEMDEIPFFTIPGTQPEKSMLYDLAQLNIQHYQDTADHQHGKHYTAIPFLAAIGLSPALDEETQKPKPLVAGGDTVNYFPNENGTSGADVKYVEFSGQGIKAISDGIGHLESQMAILGAHIIAAEKKGVESAEALRIHRIGENGVLATFTRNISTSVTMALRKKGEGDGEDLNKLNQWSINFNTDYDVSDEDIKALATLLTGRASGEIPKISIYLMLKSLNLIPEQWTFEDYIAEIEKDAHAILPTMRIVNNENETDDKNKDILDEIDEEDDD